jgi:predicted nucleic acid-binding protein
MKYLLDANIRQYVNRDCIRLKPRPYPDTQIAAIALSRDLIVVTRDTGDFPGVQTINPFVD